MMHILTVILSHLVTTNLNCPILKMFRLTLNLIQIDLTKVIIFINMNKIDLTLYNYLSKYLF